MLSPPPKVQFNDFRIMKRWPATKNTGQLFAPFDTFFQGHVQTAAQAMTKLENRFGFCFQDRFRHQIASRIQNRHRDRCLMSIQPNLLSIIHEGAPSCRR
jgi:hypothetical protein